MILNEYFNLGDKTLLRKLLTTKKVTSLDPLKGTSSKSHIHGEASPERGIPFSSLQVCKTAREQIVNKGYLKDVAIACVDNLAFITTLTDEKRKFNQVSRMKTIWETPGKRLI